MPGNFRHRYATYPFPVSIGTDRAIPWKFKVINLPIDSFIYLSEKCLGINDEAKSAKNSTDKFTGTQAFAEKSFVLLPVI